MRSKQLKKIASGFILGAVFLALGGCAAVPGLGPSPVDAYDLSAPTDITVKRKLRRAQLLIPEPTAVKMLDGEDIAVRLGGGSMQLLGGSRWADRLPKLVQARLAEAFQRSGAVGGVGRPGEGLAIDYQVIVDIRAFDVAVTTVGPLANVELYVRILNDRNGTVRASRSFTAQVPTGGDGGARFAAALDAAFNQAVREIVTWSVTAI